MLLGTLGASLLGNLLAGKGILRVGFGRTCPLLWKIIKEKKF